MFPVNGMERRVMKRRTKAVIPPLAMDTVTGLNGHRRTWNTAVKTKDKTKVERVSNPGTTKVLRDTQ